MTGAPVLAPLAATRSRGGHSLPAPTAGDVLGRLSTADDVLRFLTEDVPEHVTAALEDDLPRGAAPVRAHVTRAKLKPGRKLTVSVDVTGDGIRRLPVAVTWDLNAGMSVLVAPADPAFPQLRDVYDPARLSALVAAAGAGAGEDAGDCRLGPDLSVTALRYRPGQRHVVLVESADGTVRLFAKCYRDDTGRRAVAASETIAAALEAWGGPARAVCAAAYVESHRLVLWSGHDGTVLSERIVGSTADGVVLAALAGRMLRAVHDLGVPLAGRGREGFTDVVAEAASTRRAVDHVAALAPPVADRVGALLDLVLAELLTLPEESGHLLHGDFKCDNILVHDDELRLLDVDRVTTGDPALDLGKFTADLRWWTRSGGVDAGPFVSAFLEGYGSCPRARRRRAQLYDVMFELRSVGRRVPLHEAGWDVAVEACVTAAELTHGSAA